jgi:hypothetical protein
MATDVIRCSECGTPFKGVPLWLANAKVTFTCTSCPKKGSRGLARFEPAPEEVSSQIAELDRDPDLDGVDGVELDDDDQVIDLGEEELEPMADDKDDL